MRPTWAQIDLDAIRHNVAALCAAAPDSEFCAVVKADAYSHGAVPVARAAVDGGATWLAVALTEEAVELRHGGIEAPILILSEPRIREMAEVAELPDVRPSIYKRSGARAYAEVAPGKPVHLKVDTGMHRVGAHPDKVVALAQTVREVGLELEAVWTHLAIADVVGDEFTTEQLRRFADVIDQLEAVGIDVPMTHAANSAAALARPDARRSMVRVGIAMYGVAPSPSMRGLTSELGLRPALTLRSEVSHRLRVDAGESVSYGRRWFATEDTEIATVLIGYADGVFRDWFNGGQVLIGGRPYPVVGAVTMDQMMVAVDDSVSIGDEVILIGRQGDLTIRADEIGEHLGTIGYEVLTSVGARVPRRY